MWWINPIYFLMLVTLPVFILSSIYSGDIAELINFPNYVDIETTATGVVCTFLIMVGVFIGIKIQNKYKPRAQFDPKRYTLALNVIIIISCLAHLLLMGKFYQNIYNFYSTLRGDAGAIYALRDSKIKISGITTLTQLFYIVYPMYACYQVLLKKPIPPLTTCLILFLTSLIFIRGLFYSERLAIVEMAICYVLPVINVRREYRKVSAILPFFGAIVVYILFAIGEYFRSWPYYINIYDSFFQFVNTRLLLYVGVATNTGSALLTLSDPLYAPHFTASSMLKIFEKINFGSVNNPLETVFSAFGSNEFNNPGGILSGYVDYGLFCVLYYIPIGIISGVVYGLFKKGEIFSLLFYPSWFLGFVVITQTNFWGDQRFFLVYVFTPLIVRYVTCRNK